MLALDFGPHEEIVEKINIKIIRTYHITESCEDDDIGYKYNNFYMKKRTFKNGRLIKEIKIANPYVNDKEDEFSKAFQKAVDEEEKILKETGSRVNIL